jgi:hypothetical protein
MGLSGRDIGLIELDWSACKSGFGVAAVALQAWDGSIRSADYVGVVFRFEMGFDVRSLFGVSCANRIGRCFGGLKRVGDYQCYILTVVANHIVLKRWPPLFADTAESELWSRAEDFPDVFAVKDRPHVRHLLGSSSVECEYSAVGDRRFHRNGVQQSGKMEIGGVLREPRDFSGSIHANSVTANSGGRRRLLWYRHLCS